MKQAMIGLCVLAFACLVAVVCQCSQQMAIDTETAKRHSNRDVQRNSAQYPREIVVDCRAEVKVHLEREYIRVSMSLMNSSDAELAFLPSFMFVQVMPKLRTWYSSYSNCIMELIVDTIAPEGYLNHYTFTGSLTNQTIQLIRVPRGKVVRVEYRMPYEQNLARETSSKLYVYSGSFNVPIWRIDDPHRKGVVSRCLVPVSKWNRYRIEYKSGIGIVKGAESYGAWISQKESDLLCGNLPDSELLRVSRIDIDSVLHKVY
jgi:hypothetical protein